MQLFINDFFDIDDDFDRLHIDTIFNFLKNESYWAKQRSKEETIHSIQNSYCLGAYNKQGDQVGFARVVTDWTTFAWICDVFVIESARGIGIGKQLIRCIVDHPQLHTLRRMMLATRDAHGLYKQFGFINEDDPASIMKRIKLTS